MSADAEAPRRLIVFMHVPKTAGSTVIKVLRTNEPTRMLRIGNVFKGGGGFAQHPDYDRMAQKVVDNPQARILWGHTPFAVAAHLPREWDVRYLTILRDPVERAISQYYRVIGHARLARRGIEGRDVTFQGASELGLIVDNLQTRMLSGLDEPFGPVTDEMLRQAKDNLQRIHLVGLTERLDETLVLFGRRFGYPSILYQDERVNPDRPRGEAIPGSLRKAAALANEHDAELYRFAHDLFARAPELDDLDFQVEVSALRMATAPEPAAPDAAPPALAGADPAIWSQLLEARVALLRERGAHALTRRRLLAMEAANDQLRVLARTLLRPAQAPRLFELEGQIEGVKTAGGTQSGKADADLRRWRGKATAELVSLGAAETTKRTRRRRKPRKERARLEAEGPDPV